MRYRIISDNPGRIRVRFGTYAFDKPLEGSIRKLAEGRSFVLSAEVHSANGGLLICYRKGSRREVISFIDSLDFRAITPMPEDDATKEIDNNFKSGLTKLVVTHYAKKFLLPAPLRAALTIWNGAKYILKGLSTLSEGKLTVEVLDAASITACLAQRNFKTASTIMLMLSVSSLLEDYTHARTKAVLTSSLAVKADKVWLANGSEDVLISIDDLEIGDRIRVRTGSVIPVDGEITDGEAYINEASMTGEPLAVMKSRDDTVFAGTVVEEGSVVVRVRADRQLREPQGGYPEPRGAACGQHSAVQLPGLRAYAAVHTEYHEGGLPADGGLLLRDKAFRADRGDLSAAGSRRPEHYGKGRKVPRGVRRCGYHRVRQDRHAHQRRACAR